jgi:hypothetical protein
LAPLVLLPERLLLAERLRLPARLYSLVLSSPQQ